MMLKTQIHFWGPVWSLQGFSSAQHLLGPRITSYLFEFAVNRLRPDKQSIQESLSHVHFVQGKLVLRFLGVLQAAAT